MNPSKFLLAIATFTVCIRATAFFDEAERDTELSHFELDYVIEEYPDVEYNEVAEVSEGESIKLLYTLKNEEEKVLTVVGLGGSFRDPLTGAIVVNLTSTEAGPIVISPGDSTSIGQRIKLDFGNGNFLLSPQVFVAFNDQLKAIQARPQLMVVKEVPLSLLDPQLLFLELIFFAVLGGGLYFAKASFFQKQQGEKAKASPQTTNSNFDPAWVPVHHQVLRRGNKSRKAY